MAVEAFIFEQIVDANFDQAIYTASPNATINVVQIAAAGSGTNIGLALTPKGTGYISVRVPDGAAEGGNARGANSVDLQMTRSTASQVASGSNSALLNGISNTASGTAAIAGGQSCTASGTNSFSIGSSCVASGSQSVGLGSQSQATATNSSAIGASNVASGTASLATGSNAAAHLTYMRAHGGFGLQAAGASQEVAFVLSGKTTTNTQVILPLFPTLSPVLRSGSVWHGILHITGSKSDGSAVASYHRQVTIKRVGNTTSLVGTVNTIGTDEAAGTSVSITADDTNEALSVGVTGVSGETWRWVAVFHGAELLIGS